MVQLLAIEKARLISEKGYVTSQDFREAWQTCWWEMVLEKSWAHATRFRRGSRIAMLTTRHEYRTAFVDQPTAFAYATARLGQAADGMCLRLTPAEIPAALLAAIAYVQTLEDRDAMTDELVAA